jgi:Asp-tRNA(Asn)/Glu-tRNA(Gln) amidotransferase C subunit
MASYRAGTRLWQSIARNPCLQRHYSSKPQNADIEAMLAEPSWSVRSLLPNKAADLSTTSVTPQKLRHLLRLSALPQPSNPEEEQSMLRTLESQIHFVQEMQRVDTTGVEPLRSIRDESAAAVKETTIGLARLKDALAKERVSGRRRRVQRMPSARNGHPEEAMWNGNALDSASKKKGPYFVVETGSGQSS